MNRPSRIRTAAASVALACVVAWAVGTWAQSNPPPAEPDPEAVLQPAEDEGGLVAVVAEVRTEVGSGEGSGDADTAADPPSAALGRSLGEAVVARALDATPNTRDPRLAALRTGGISPEAAEALGVPIGELTVRETVRSRLQEFRARLATAQRDLPAVRTNHSAAVHRANELFDVLSVRDTPSPQIATQLVLMQRMASQLASRQFALEREFAFTGVAVAYLEDRQRVVELAAAQPAPTAVTDQASEIIAERQRLEQAAEVTASLEARAREGQERAREERAAAQTPQEVARADRKIAISARITEITGLRDVEEDEIARLTARREAFAANQIEHSAALESIQSEDDRAVQSRRADAEFDAIAAERDEVREVARERRAALRAAHANVIAAQEPVDGLRERLATGAIPSGEIDPEDAVAQRELYYLELEMLEANLELEKLRYDNAESFWSLNEAQIHFYARAADRLIPLLSRERQRSLFMPTRENLAEVRRNIAERVVGLRLTVASLFGQGAHIDTERSATWRAVEPLLIVLALLVAVRALPRYRDALVLRIVELRQHPSLRRFTPAVLKFGEVAHESAAELIAWAGSYAVFRVLADLPLLRMLAIWWFWIAGYRFVLAVVETLVMPRSARAPVYIGDAPNEVRLGVDVFDFDANRGRLIVRTTRMIGLYLVVGRIGLAAVRFVFGPGFFFFWAGWLFNVALFALVYAVAWWWRKAIVEEFVERAGERARKFGGWLERHQGKFYSVLVVIVLAAVLVADGVVRVVGSWLGGRGPGQILANFAVRKKLERAADNVVVDAARKTVLPVAYQRVFRDHPLDEEPYRVPRPMPLGAVRQAFSGWQAESGHGTVAVVGDAGSGKTTFANEVARHFGEEIEVVRAAVPNKLTTAASVHAWFIETFELECEPARDAIVERLGQVDPRVAVVDQCENLFLRTVGGFAGVDEFLDICTLTNHRVFWVLAFDRYPWSYLHRVRDRRGYFREIVRLRPFTDEQLRQMIEARNDTVGVHPNFDRLVGGDGGSDQYFELVKTAAGYFRLLAEYSRGNLRVAQHYWLQSLVKDEDGTVHVTLFSRPDASGLKSMTDELLFALTALVQHRGLTNAELADALDLQPTAADVITNLLRETGYVEPCGARRLRVATRTYFAVLGRLRQENFLHLD